MVTDISFIITIVNLDDKYDDELTDRHKRKDFDDYALTRYLRSYGKNFDQHFAC